MSSIVSDANATNPVDRYAPGWAKPYLKLARFDRPIGAWLLLFPCWWGQALAELHLGHAAPNLWYMLLFAIGAFVMRGAGCTWNDIVDRDFDGRVARTALRPIPSGQVKVWQAVAFGVGLSLIGFLVLIQFNLTTIVVAISSIVLIVIYPFAKRFTYWPQLVLGLTFKWGALVGWTAITGAIGLPSLVLYAGCVLWTIGYDTIYAHQDKEDDALLGLKSTALRLGDNTPAWLIGLYTGAVLLWGIAGWLAGAGLVFAIGLTVAAAQLAWQVRTLNISDSTNCLVRFRSNRFVGWIVLAAIVGDLMIRAST